MAFGTALNNTYWRQCYEACISVPVMQRKTAEHDTWLLQTLDVLVLPREKGGSMQICAGCPCRSAKPANHFYHFTHTVTPLHQFSISPITTSPLIAPHMVRAPHHVTRASFQHSCPLGWRHFIHHFTIRLPPLGQAPHCHRAEPSGVTVKWFMGFGIGSNYLVTW